MNCVELSTKVLVGNFSTNSTSYILLIETLVLCFCIGFIIQMWRHRITLSTPIDIDGTSLHCSRSCLTPYTLVQNIFFLPVCSQINQTSHGILGSSVSEVAEWRRSRCTFWRLLSPRTSLLLVFVRYCCDVVRMIDDRVYVLEQYDQSS